MIRQQLKKQYFILGTLLLCLGYLGFELFFTSFTTIGVDEFWFAHWIHRYKDGIPYRDFPPYKTVLGYYLLLIPMIISHIFSKVLLGPLFYIKNSIAILNTLLFFISALWLKKYFPKPAVLSGLALLISAEFVLTFSTNIRVDFLAYWFCLFSALLLLEKRFILAGLIIGLGFLTSQKALWYIMASNSALGLCWLLFNRDWKNFRSILQFNFAFLFCVIIYIVFWSSFANLKTVLNNMFYEAYIMYQVDWYASARKLFWTISITQNPAPFLLWPLALISLFIIPQQDKLHKLRVFCVTYGSVIMLCLIPYKQIFPYYMLTAIPALLLLYIAFFAWLEALISSHHKFNILCLNKASVWILLVLYNIGLLVLILLFNLPTVYFLINLFTFFLGIYLTQLPKKIFADTQAIIPLYGLLILILVGLVYPLAFFATSLPNRSGDYQKSVLRVANALLLDGTDYIAGIELFYNKNQPIQGMRHLGSFMVAYLSQPSKKIRPALLESLYMTPNVTASQVIDQFKNSHVKFFVNNYRMMSLPPIIKNYLMSEYEHFWGSIYLYAPLIKAHTNTVKIKFSGNYQLESQTPTFINGKKITPNAKIRLEAGEYNFSSSQDFRLKLIPDNIQNMLDRKYESDEWPKMLG